MRVRISFFVLVCLVFVMAFGGPAMAAQNATRTARNVNQTKDLGREILAANDGWASFSTGTTGGSKAAADKVFTVTNRKELVAALNNGDAAPKIIIVKGTIDANVDDNNKPVTCDAYATNGYTLKDYMAAFDPKTWDKTKKPSGAAEDARVASQKKQAERIKIKVGSNTTLIGFDNKAVIRGANLDVTGVDNIIIRNLTFRDAYDCFPQWDPTDGAEGNWNSQYDNISLVTATHVWVDHCAFDDGDNPDSKQPLYFNRPYQVHDGELDITKGSDYVTVSWNRFSDHDKTMLIGSSDNPGTADTPAYDKGKLRVTVHHNAFINNFQRLPRVRFGQVHVYNNYYEITDAKGFVYSWGAGIESQLYVENNYVRLGSGIKPDQVIRSYKGTAIFVTGTLVKGDGDAKEVDVLAAYNAANDPDLKGEAGWKPTLFVDLTTAKDVPTRLPAQAGPFATQP